MRQVFKCSFYNFFTLQKEINHFLLHVSRVGGATIVDNAVFVLLNTFSKLRCENSKLLLRQWCLVSYCSACRCETSVYSNPAVKTLEMQKSWASG